DSVLMDRWREGRPIDSARVLLAQRQFDFYASTLCQAHQCGADNDVPVVDRARSFLKTYAGPEQVYQAIVGEASRRFAPVQFMRKYPGAAAVLVGVNDVPGAFTPGGWQFMRS